MIRISGLTRRALCYSSKGSVNKLMLPFKRRKYSLWRRITAVRTHQLISVNSDPEQMHFCLPTVKVDARHQT
ncbi:hypothetical protein N9R04_08365 [Staphylococcus sp. SQ8-PEA]|uniref:Uncharacterized protein n=1 Tax=Staphylococcus marylandisciuri TaxID=2981529 RepID=A0ABT2QRY3_9STAP|nr:hypothetical protein [Staphylococcus marylandisciuri]MCU5746720.1 hypothetical protein [Staphylococcus marylandisciuri]